MSLTRELGDLPANVCTPTYLGNAAKKIAREFKQVKVDVLDRKRIEALKMGSFLSVAQGSYEPPAFIVLNYTPAAATKKTKKEKKDIGRASSRERVSKKEK